MYVARTLEGTLVETAPGRAAIELLTGTAEPAPVGPLLDGYRYETPDFAAELPTRWELALTTQQVAATDQRARERGYMDSTYRDFVLAALPRFLPKAELGEGARWRIVTHDGNASTTITWEVTAWDGDTLTLDGSGTSGPTGTCEPSMRCLGLAAVEVHTVIDLATFSLDAIVKRSSRASSSSGLTSQRSESDDTGTVSIKR